MSDDYGQSELIRAALTALDGNSLRRWNAPTGPCPIYDALARERDTGRDSRGRFVRRSA